MAKYTYKMTIGDWSDDGHGKSDQFVFETNTPEDQIRQGYLDAITKSGVALHHTDSGYVTGKFKGFERPKNTIAILVDYETSNIPKETLLRLKNLGVKFDQFDNEEEEGELYCSCEDAAKLFLEMVRTQINGFEYKLKNDDIKSINGFWGDLNVQIGYGTYG